MLCLLPEIVISIYKSTEVRNPIPETLKSKNSNSVLEQLSTKNGTRVLHNNTALRERVYVFVERQTDNILSNILRSTNQYAKAWEVQTNSLERCEELSV